MITCAYCGTSHTTFQSNCPNCGAALPIPEQPSPNEFSFASDTKLTAPPPVPRNAPTNYIRRALFTSAAAITGLVFGILGIVFTLVGAGLTIAIITIFVGIPFLGLGLLFLVVGGGLLFWKYGQARQKLAIYQHGEATLGEIISVQENYSVRVNGRHPWIISYRFQAVGQTYEGKYWTLENAGASYHPTQQAYILYKLDNPAQNTLYIELI